MNRNAENWSKRKERENEMCEVWFKQDGMVPGCERYRCL